VQNDANERCKSIGIATTARRRRRGGKRQRERERKRAQAGDRWWRNIVRRGEVGSAVCDRRSNGVDYVLECCSSRAER